MRVYDALPQDAQRALLEKHLVPLLDHVPKVNSRNAVLSAATRLQKKYLGIPILDIRKKKIEIQSLLDEINRDSKRSFVKERSNKDELTTEVIDSLTDWLNDIWTLVYEFNVEFAVSSDALLDTNAVLMHRYSWPTHASCLLPMS
jgi:hypothetical protein